MPFGVVDTKDSCFAVGVSMLEEATSAVVDDLEVAHFYWGEMPPSDANDEKCEGTEEHQYQTVFSLSRQHLFSIRAHRLEHRVSRSRLSDCGNSCVSRCVFCITVDVQLPAGPKIKDSHRRNCKRSWA